MDKISVVSAADLVYEEGETKPQSDYLDFPVGGGAELIGTIRPKTRELKNELLFSAISGGRDLDRRVEYYVPIESVADEIKHWLRPLSELMERGDSGATLIEQRLTKLNMPVENVGYLPVAGRSRDCVALIDRSTAEVLAFVLLSPDW